MPYRIVREIDDPDAAGELIAEPLFRFNAQHGPPVRYLPIALTLVADDVQTGAAVQGGLWGKCYFDWLFVEYLVVPEDARGTGLGSGLLAQAEAIARANGCIGVWLDTFSFQALPFYQKLGFSIFGQIEGHPIGGTRYFLQKRF